MFTIIPRPASTILSVFDDVLSFLLWIVTTSGILAHYLDFSSWARHGINQRHVINQEEIALGFNKLSYIRTLPKFMRFFVLYLIALRTRIRKEEKELIAKFGEEYKEYAKETSPLIPKLKGK